MADQIEKIVDLDLLLGEPINVKLGGVVWRLPADCPAELYLQMLQVAQETGDDEDDPGTVAVRELELFLPLRDGLLELFQVHQPNLPRLPAAMGLEMLVASIGRIYGQGEAGPTAEQAAEESPPPPSPGTKKQTPKRKRSTSAPARASASTKS